jgi:hypothetical protein
MGEALMPARLVRPGEHLDEIAYRHGVRPEEIWDRPDNASVREGRPGGHMLVAGEILNVPEGRHPPSASITTGGSTAFVATIPRVTVDIALARGGKPLEGEPWRIEGSGESAKGVTGADGRVKFEVRVTTRKVKLVLERLGTTRELAVGALDPPHVISGSVHRLKNLGFYSGPLGVTKGPELESAVKAFQKEVGISPTGALDPETVAELVKRHGS